MTTKNTRLPFQEIEPSEIPATINYKPGQRIGARLVIEKKLGGRNYQWQIDKALEAFYFGGKAVAK